MFPDVSSVNSEGSNTVAQAGQPKRLESIAYYIFLATVILAPIVFWPTQIVAIDFIKTIVISLGVIISAVLYCVVLLKERRVVLPPRSIFWTSLLLLASLVISSWISIHFGKSFFGQGFESGTASFILVLFLGGLVASTVVVRRVERVVAIYSSIVGIFLLTYLFQVLRLIFGQGFISLSVLTSRTATLFGTWYDLGIYCLLVALITLLAIVFLPLSKRLKIFYWFVAILAGFGAFVINYTLAWSVACVLFLGLTIFLSCLKPSVSGGRLAAFFKRLAWIPLVACVIAFILSWQGAPIASSLINKIDANYSELRLPWQMTLDVTAGAIKSYPLFGVGSNHWTQAYLFYKPLIINSTNAWNVEFTNGFGLLPTFIATQGLVGTILWILLLVFLGVLGAHVLRRLPSNPGARFILVSSYASSVFLWLMLLVSVPSHSVLFLTFVLTGVFLGSSVSYGSVRGLVWAPKTEEKSYKFIPVVFVLTALVFAIWGLVYLKKTVALTYFGNGMKQLSVLNDPDKADADFSRSLAYDSSDFYWRARVEAQIAKANKLAGTVTSTTATSTAQATVKQIVDILNQATAFASSSIASDPTNYYNFISQARVYQAEASINVPSAYDNTVKAYTTAIGLNQYNPSLYLNLAQFQAQQNKLAEAQKTIGSGLQVKNDYLDLIFLLSQVEAAQGNLKDAITAANVAVQMNPSNPTLLFQLGLLSYENKNYDVAAQALGAAVQAQPNYANAKYFLGLSLVRLNKIADAVQQFTDLSKVAPDSKEVAFILSNLKAGKSPFADAQPPITANPEKRASLPIKEKTK